MLKRKEKVKVSSIPESPYVAGKREWNETYGSFISSARAWRMTAYISLCIAALAMFRVVYDAGESKIVPYVVEIDKKANTVNTYPAEKLNVKAKGVIKAMLAGFISDWRTVATDIAVQRRFVEDTYAFIRTDFPSYMAVGEWYQNNDPFKRAQSMTIEVELNEILPVSDTTWRVEWQETVRSRKGETLHTYHYTGTLGVSTGNAVTPKNIIKNPIGLYVTELNWSRDITINQGVTR
ncbi:hypothetical protein JFQ72_004382 [Vibrio parahaemolyticus]|nr:hypothetical protein [Vibrio parahaemolyticus]